MNKILIFKFVISGWRSGSSRRGQAILESCAVVIIICILLFGLFQLSRLFVAEEILQFAAARGARARAIGMNDFMVYKTIRAATIVNAGKMQQPLLVDGSDPLAQRQVEQVRIPSYLGAEWHYQLPYYLAYEDWNTVHHSIAENGGDPPMIDSRVRQDFPLRAPLHRLIFFGADTFELRGSSQMEAHYPLYLDVP